MRSSRSLTTRSNTPNNSSGSTVSPVSSSASRATPWRTVSPNSSTPPGIDHSPVSGSCPRFTSRTRALSIMTAPTPMKGRSGYSRFIQVLENSKDTGFCRWYQKEKYEIKNGACAAKLPQQVYNLILCDYYSNRSNNQSFPCRFSLRVEPFGGRPEPSPSNESERSCTHVYTHCGVPRETGKER